LNGREKVQLGILILLARPAVSPSTFSANLARVILPDRLRRRAAGAGPRRGVTGDRILLFFHGGAYRVGSPAMLRHLLGLVSEAAQARVGDAGILLDDSTGFTASASTASVVTLEVWDDIPHVWHTVAGLLPEADQAVECIGRWLQERIPAG
jgi:acetyl esterase/lipase